MLLIAAVPLSSQQPLEKQFSDAQEDLRRVTNLRYSGTC